MNENMMQRKIPFKYKFNHWLFFLVGMIILLLNSLSWNSSFSQQLLKGRP